MAGHAVVSQAAVTSPGTQNFTRAGLGVPVGYLMLGSRVTAPNSNVSDLSHSWGASDLDAVNGVMYHTNSEDAQGTADSQSIFQTDELLRLANPGQANAEEQANHNATVTDGIQLDWITTTVARQCSAIIFSEGVANFDVRAVLLNGTGSTTITPGFMPDLIIAFSPSKDTEFGGTGHVMGASFYKRSTDVYASIGMMANNGSTTPVSAERYDESEIPGSTGSTGSFSNSYTLDAFTGTGFDATKVSGSNARYMIFVSIQLAAGYSSAVGSQQAPASTGIAPFLTGLDHTPQIALFLGNGQTAVGSDNGQGTFFFGACTADNEMNMGGFVQDFTGPNNSNTGSHHRSDSCIYHTTDSGALNCQGSLNALQSGGIDMNFSNVDLRPQIGYMTIGKVPPSGVTPLSAGGIILNP